LKWRLIREAVTYWLQHFAWCIFITWLSRGGFMPRGSFCTSLLRKNINANAVEAPLWWDNAPAVCGAGEGNPVHCLVPHEYSVLAPRHFTRLRPWSFFISFQNLSKSRHFFHLSDASQKHHLFCFRNNLMWGFHTNRETITRHQHRKLQLKGGRIGNNLQNLVNYIFV